MRARIGEKASAARLSLLASAAVVALWTVLQPRTADLAAQVHRTGLFQRAGRVLWDDNWFGGHHLPGYTRTGDVQVVSAIFDRMTTIPSDSHVAEAEYGSAQRPAGRPTMRQMLNKVPEVTLYFWIIKILCTTVGETAADYLNVNLGFGLTNTTYAVSAILAVALVFQFRLRLYVPTVYWLAVVLISIVGTLITDNLVDNLGVALTTSTIAFAIALAVTFAAWYAGERTLSIHTIVTRRREAFYWLAVLFTFALGTAAGDLLAEKIDIGYWKSALVFGGAIAIVFFAHRVLKLNAILAFWIAYVLTRPFGASIGDYLSQPKPDGGLGLGTTVTSVIFLTAIATTVAYLTMTKKDRTERLVAQPAPA